MGEWIPSRESTRTHTHTCRQQYNVALFHAATVELVLLSTEQPHLQNAHVRYGAVVGQITTVVTIKENTPHLLSYCFHQNLAMSYGVLQGKNIQTHTENSVLWQQLWSQAAKCKQCAAAYCPKVISLSAQPCRSWGMWEDMSEESCLLLFAASLLSLKCVKAVRDCHCEWRGERGRQGERDFLWTSH